MIREVSRLLVKYFGIDHCYRIGGDEFLIISGFGKKGCEDRIESLRDELSSFDTDGKKLSPTISCGIYRVACDYDNNLRSLKESADQLLYRVKKNGKNGFAYEADPFLPEKDVEIGI